MFLQGCSQQESVRFKHLYKQNGLWTKKFSTVPFSGKTTGLVQTTIKDGKMIGEYLSFFNNGKLNVKCFYDKDGEYHGEYLSYSYTDGSLYIKSFYKNGKKIGLHETYHRSGVVWIIENYNNNGEKHGYEKWFCSNGQLQKEILYSNDKIVEDFDIYNCDGKYEKTRKLQNGLCCVDYIKRNK